MTMLCGSAIFVLFVVGVALAIDMWQSVQQ